MKHILVLILLSHLTPSYQLPTLNVDETITTGGKAITLLRERGKSLRLGHRDTPFFRIGDLKNPPGTYPWEVSVGIYVTTQSKAGINLRWSHVCGGVILSGSHIVTSANCLEFMVKSEYIGCNVTDIHVRAGDYNLRTENEVVYSANVDVQESKVLKYTVHPEFNTTKNEHYKNIAVIEIETPFTFDDINVRPVYLPTIEEAESITKEADTDISLVLAGWGYWTTKSGRKQTPGKVLRDGVIASFNDIYCDSVYNGTRLSHGFTDDVMCGASPLNLAGLCCGDDGSGVVKLDHKKQRFVLTGVLSLGTDWNYDGIFCGHKNKPNVFIRVASKSIISFLYEAVYGISPHNNSENIANEFPKKKVSQYISQECGLNSVIEDGYMGKIKPGVWPWLVSLRRKEMVNPDDYYPFDSYDSHDNVTYEWRHFCGGTILSRNHILTAAHCVAKITNLDSFKIRAGDVLLNNNIDEQGIQEVSVKYFTKHPKYHLRYFDLAVLELAFPLNFTKVVKQICLLSLEEAMNITKADEEYLPLAIAGYGNNGDALNHGVATVFSEETCNRTHPAERDYINLVPNLFTEDTMCAGDISGEAGTCRGDSGSGAVHFHQNRQQYILRAVVSGSARGECGSMLYPNVYVRMATPDVMQWIFDEINFSSPKSVNLSIEKMMQSGEEVVKYSCTSSPSRPASTIKWTIIDGNENHVTYENKLDTVEETPEGFISNSSFVLVKPTTIKVQCEAENVVGKNVSDKVFNTGFGWFILESFLQKELVLQYGDNWIPVIRTRSDNDLQPQLWKFDGEQIISKKNGKVLDIRSPQKGPNATTIMYEKHGGANQQFKFDHNQIVSIRDETVLSVMGAGGNGTQVHMDHRNETNAQKWRQIFPDSGWFLLESFLQEGLVLQYGDNWIPVIRTRSDNDLQPQLWKCDGDQIVSKKNRKVLDIRYPQNGPNATTVMYGKHGGANQQFKFEHNQIVSIRDKTVLSVLGAGDNGAQVHMEQNSGTNAQKWRKRFID